MLRAKNAQQIFNAHLPDRQPGIEAEASLAVLHGVLRKCGWTNKLQLIANPIFSSGWTNIAEHFILTSTSGFHSAAVVGGRNTNATPAAKPCPLCTSITQHPTPVKLSTQPINNHFFINLQHKSLQNFTRTNFRKMCGSISNHGFHTLCPPHCAC
jgi:hypothetical protein